ncbi:hypothetical protein MW887_004520 [Aspergillus wentii]|nr:hypothetical protein MW887_004520 [Aspergillus wentii]
MPAAAATGASAARQIRATFSSFQFPDSDFLTAPCFSDLDIPFLPPTTTASFDDFPDIDTLIAFPNALNPSPIPGPDFCFDPIPDFGQSLGVESAPYPPQPTHSQPSPMPAMPALTPRSSSASSRDASPKDSSSSSSSSYRVSKRQMNTMAARRYRQRKVDRMSELEAELESVKRERDELRMRVSKLEGETEALRGLVEKK